MIGVALCIASWRLAHFTFGDIKTFAFTAIWIVSPCAFMALLNYLIKRGSWRIACALAATVTAFECAIFYSGLIFSSYNLIGFYLFCTVYAYFTYVLVVIVAMVVLVLIGIVWKRASYKSETQSMGKSGNR